MTANVDMPEWTRQFRVPGLELLEQKREGLLEKMRELEEALEQVDKDIQARRMQCDILLAGQGENLLQSIQDTLRELGGDPGPSEDNDTMFPLSLDDSAERPCAVVYISSGENPVERREARALADKLNDYWDRFGDPKPKGILISNSYNATDPRERNGEAFSEEILNFCQQNDFCLLTSIQLFNAYYAFMMGDLKDGRSFIESLLKTTMEYPKFLNVQQAIRNGSH